jgi:hypothetical protein
METELLPSQSHRFSFHCTLRTFFYFLGLRLWVFRFGLIFLGAWGRDRVIDSGVPQFLFLCSFPFLCLLFTVLLLVLPSSTRGGAKKGRPMTNTRLLPTNCSLSSGSKFRTLSVQGLPVRRKSPYNWHVDNVFDFAFLNPKYPLRGKRYVRSL